MTRSAEAVVGEVLCDLCLGWGEADYVLLALALADILELPGELLLAVLMEPAAELSAGHVAAALARHRSGLATGDYDEILQPALDTVGGDDEMIRLLVAALDRAGMSVAGQIAAAKLALRAVPS